MPNRLIERHNSFIASTFASYVYEITNPATTEFIYSALPKGTICITVCLTGEYYVRVAGGWEKQNQSSVFGLVRKGYVAKMSAHHRAITVGFLPHLFQLLTRESMYAIFANGGVDLGLLFKKECVDKLVFGLMTSSTDADIIFHIETFIKSHLLTEKEDNRLHAAHQLIHRGEIYNVNRLIQHLNLSPTAFRKLFREKVGLTPKEMIRIARIQKALRLRAEEEESLTRIAYNLQYFDQSHFIHDFKEILGLTPKQYYKKQILTDCDYGWLLID